VKRVVCKETWRGLAQKTGRQHPTWMGISEGVVSKEKGDITPHASVSVPTSRMVLTQRKERRDSANPREDGFKRSLDVEIRGAK